MSKEAQKLQIGMCVEEALLLLREQDPDLEQVVRKEKCFIAGMIGDQTNDEFIVIDYTRQVPNDLEEYIAMTQYIYDGFRYCPEDIC